MPNYEVMVLIPADGDPVKCVQAVMRRYSMARIFDQKRRRPCIMHDGWRGLGDTNGSGGDVYSAHDVITKITNGVWGVFAATLPANPNDAVRYEARSPGRPIGVNKRYAAQSMRLLKKHAAANGRVVPVWLCE